MKKLIVLILFGCSNYEEVVPTYCYECNGLIINQIAINAAEYQKINVTYCVTEKRIKEILWTENTVKGNIHKSLECKKK